MSNTAPLSVEQTARTTTSVNLNETALRIRAEDTYPAQENYYSTIRRRKEFLNITVLTMSSSLYGPGDSVKSRSGHLHLEPMYIDVLDRSILKKSSRKMGCLVMWMIMLTLMSLASLAFTAFIFYTASISNRKANANSNSQTNGKGFLGLMVMLCI